MKGWGSAVWRWLPAVAAVVGVLGLLWVILVVAPPWFVPDQSLEGLRAQKEVRTTLLQGLGGAALLVGAYVTYRQLQTSREGQITERFTRAIDQLGSEHLDVRLGGLYALERIARDSPADRASIGGADRLCPHPCPLAAQPARPARRLGADRAGAEVAGAGAGRAGEPLGAWPWRLCRRARPYRWLDLSAVDLRRADLRDAHLGDVDLRFAGLQKAYFGGAHLDGANLDGTQLEGAVADDRTAWPDGFNWRAAGVATAK